VKRRLYFLSGLLSLDAMHFNLFDRPFPAILRLTTEKPANLLT